MMREIELTKGFVAVVDDFDFDRVMSAGSWCASVTPRTVYALRGIPKPGGGRTTIRLHNFVTGWRFVDHINGNGLDNQRSNLRESDAVTNGCNVGPKSNNTSGFKGVTWDRRSRRWRAQIQSGGTNHYLGDFTEAAEAARAYDAKALELHGDFARTNFNAKDIAS